jgi:hypothetical protein
VLRLRISEVIHGENPHNNQLILKKDSNRKSAMA